MEKNNAIEFFKWCNTPVYKSSNELGFRSRVQPQFLEYDTYTILNDKGYCILPEGTFLTAEQLYDYWATNVGNCVPDEIHSTKKELLECVQNLMGVFDTPVSRRRITGNFAEEVRAIGRDILERNGKSIFNI